MDQTKNEVLIIIDQLSEKKLKLLLALARGLVKNPK